MQITISNYFMDKSELKLASLSIFPFGATYVLSKDQHLHILSSMTLNCEEENPQINHRMEFLQVHILPFKQINMRWLHQ